MIQDLIRHTRVLEIVGDTIRVKASGAAFGELALVENVDGETSLAKVVELDREIVSLQVEADRRVGAGGQRADVDGELHALAVARARAGGAQPTRAVDVVDAGAGVIEGAIARVGDVDLLHRRVGAGDRADALLARAR